MDHFFASKLLIWGQKMGRRRLALEVAQLLSYLATLDLTRLTSELTQLARQKWLV